MDSETLFSFSKFAQDTQLCDAVDIPEGRDAIHRDPDRLERAETPLPITKPDLGSDLSLGHHKRCCCLAFAPACYEAQPGIMALRVGPLKIQKSNVVTQQSSEERPVSLWSGTKTQSTRLKSKGPTDPAKGQEEELGMTKVADDDDAVQALGMSCFQRDRLDAERDVAKQRQLSPPISDELPADESSTCLVGTPCAPPDDGCTPHRCTVASEHKLKTYKKQGKSSCDFAKGGNEVDKTVQHCTMERPFPETEVLIESEHVGKAMG
ncbi:hypothetical protein WISP_121859 [Willisornis vidua]|uniref:Uncharacterized protein n=1 Tax=Willisornis vidua TaxID=1566151 RepID=A0ABQ9CT97_9PASS|nr:hypothetical protein WISP_121859 [Willisornis vidua]